MQPKGLKLSFRDKLILIMKLRGMHEQKHSLGSAQIEKAAQLSACSARVGCRDSNDWIGGGMAGGQSSVSESSSKLRKFLWRFTEEHISSACVSQPLKLAGPDRLRHRIIHSTYRRANERAGE